MSKSFLFTLLTILLIPIAWNESRADQDSIAEIKAEMNFLKERMAELEKKLEKVTKEEIEISNDLVDDSEIKEDSSVTLQDAENVIEDILNENNVVTSANERKVKINGEFEFEYLDTQKDSNTYDEVTTPSSGTDEHNGFQVDRFSLTTVVDFSEDVQWLTKVQFDSGNTEDDTADIDEAHLRVSKFLEFFGVSDQTDGFLSMGLQDPFELMSRYTENHNLVTTAFHRDEDLGILYGANYEEIYWRASLTNGNKLGDRSANDGSSGFEMIGDDERNGDANSNKELSFGLGHQTVETKYGQTNFLGFYNFAKLSDEDLEFLRGIHGYDPTSNDDQTHEIGAYGKYSYENFQTWGMFVAGGDGEIDRNGFAVETSYLIDLPGIQKNGRQYFTRLRPLINYSNLKVEGIGHVPVDARTWNREKIIFAIIAEMTTTLQFKFEYAINDEFTGGDSVDNNELLAQMELIF